MRWAHQFLEERTQTPDSLSFLLWDQLFISTPVKENRILKMLHFEWVKNLGGFVVHKIPVYTQSTHVFQLGRVLCPVSSFPMPPLTCRETKKQRQAMTFGSRREGHKSVSRVSSSLPSLPRKRKLLQVRETHVMCSSPSFCSSAVICHSPISCSLCWGCFCLVSDIILFYS